MLRERFVVREGERRFYEWSQGKVPLTATPLSHCYPHKLSYSLTAIEISAVAKGLVSYLRSRSNRELTRKDESDDTEMRLLMAFFEELYPCKKP